jgi:Domain of unknown function (DUF4192)
MAASPSVPSSSNARLPEPQTKLRLTTPPEVLAAVPYLLGFTPERSAVVLCMHGKQLGLTMRADLDMPAYELRGMLQDRIRADGADTALLVLFDPEPGAEGTRPGAQLAKSLIRTFRQDGILVRDALGVRERRYWSYLCRDVVCCPAQGREIPDAGQEEHTRIAATFVGIGSAPLTSRAALDATLDGVRGPMAVKVMAGLSDALRTPWPHPIDHWWNLVERYTDVPPRPGSGLPLREATRLIVSLRDVMVRDEIISWTGGAALTGILTLLKELTPLALPPYDTQLLTTLAWAAYSEGDGALAAMALERVLDADPEHHLAQLLWAALEGGIEPAILRELSLQMWEPPPPPNPLFARNPGGR